MWSASPPADCLARVQISHDASFLDIVWLGDPDPYWLFLCIEIKQSSLVVSIPPAENRLCSNLTISILFIFNVDGGSGSVCTFRDIGAVLCGGGGGIRICNEFFWKFFYLS